MYTYIDIFAHIHMYTYIHIYTHTYIRIYIYLYPYAYVHIIYKSMYAYKERCRDLRLPRRGLGSADGASDAGRGRASAAELPGRLGVLAVSWLQISPV